MPRAPRFKTAFIDDLFRQLRFAPAETRERLLEQAERLATEIRPGRAYPEEFVVFRVTGYRPGSVEHGVMLVGDALLADLAVFVRRLSETLELPAASPSRGQWESVDNLARRLDVTDRTVRRWHQRGLLLHSVVSEDGERRLGCYPASLESFRRRIGDDELKRAGAFSRMEPDSERVILQEALELARSERLSRQAIARRLAPRHQRAVETVRAVLVRHEEAMGCRVFPGMEHTDAQERRVIVRAAARGVLVADIARRLGRNVVTVRRVVNRDRLRRLRGLGVTGVVLSTFQLDDAADVILAPAWVRFGLHPAEETDAISFLSRCRAAAVPNPAALEARAVAFNFLKHRADVATRAAGADPPDALLDRAETDLRWAVMLKRTMVHDLLPIATGRADVTIARPLIQQSADTIRSVLSLLVSAVSEAVEAFDPAGRQRLDRFVAYSVDRALARRVGAESTSRAGARHADGSIPIADPLAHLMAWQAAIECPLRLVTRIARLNGSHRDAFGARHGQSGEAPMTVQEVGQRFGWSRRRTDRLLSEAMALVRRPD